MDQVLHKVKDAILNKDDANESNQQQYGGVGHSGGAKSNYNDGGYRDEFRNDGHGNQGGGGGGGAAGFDSGRPHEEHRPPQGYSDLYPQHPSGGDYSEAKHYAEKHSNNQQDSSLFTTALSFLTGKEKDIEAEDVDENDYVDKHKRVYENSESGNSKSIGTAAAMQALKAFTSGGSTGSGSGKQDSSASSSSAFVGLAMAECAKLFDQQSSKGQVESGASKQDAINTAAQMALKLLLKSKMDSGAGSGGGGSGNMLMSLAGQLMKSK